MKEMLFYSPKRRKPIVFDDWTDNTEEYDSYWCAICESCYKKHKKILGKRIDDHGSGICSVKGCNNEAEHYVDFDMYEVTFKEREENTNEK